jgi:hypothetical protein
MPQGVLPFQIEGEQATTGLTSHAGLLPFVELMVRGGLLGAAGEHVGLRGSEGQGFTDGQFLLSFTLLNLVGGESVSDLDVLEADDGLSQMARAAEVSGLTGHERRAFRRRFGGARPRTFASASAAFRYLDGFHDPEAEKLRVEGKAFIPAPNHALRGLYRVNAKLIEHVQRQSPQSLATLDQDATLVEAAKRESKWSYKGFPGYQPLNVYWAEHDLVLHSEFRDGNVPAGFEQLRVLRESLAFLPESVKKVRLRSDSAGYQVDLLRYCAEGKDERFGVIDFAIASDVTKEFKAAVAQVGLEEWHTLYRTVNGRQQKTDQEWAEVCFVPNSLSTRKGGPAYRFLAIREPLEQLDLPGVDSSQATLPFPTMEFENGAQYKLFGVVTNMGIPGDELIWWHRERCGRSEAAHAIMKDDLAGGRLPSGKFGVNAAWWAMMIISYNLAAAMKRVVLGGAWIHKRMKAVRFGFINVAARLVRHAGAIIVRVCERHPAFTLLQEARVAIFAQSLAPS